MHVPDGYLPIWLLFTMYAISGAVAFYSIRRINRTFDDRLVPYMGVLAAVIFAAQLVNFQVPPSSGHLVGSTLLAVMVGPFAGTLIMALVLFVQALYADGGLLTYGLNLFNMGVFSCFLGWSLAFIMFRGLRKFTEEKRAVLVGTAFAAFVTTVLAAFVLGLELLTVPGFNFLAVAAVTWIHVFIGIGEAILTFVILLYFVRAKPGLVSFLKDSEVKEMAVVVGEKEEGPQERVTIVKSKG